MLKRVLIAVTVTATATAGVAVSATAQDVGPGLEVSEPSKAVEESDNGSYIVVMDEDPVVAVVGQDRLDTPRADALAADLVEAQDEVLESVGAGPEEKVNTYTTSLNGFSATLSYEDAQALAADPKVTLVLPDELRQKTTDSSPRYLGLTRRGGAWSTGLTGEDVVVGIIDNGIWPEHPSFADDGSYPDLGVTLDETFRPSCEFGNTAHNPDDVPFTCNNKLLGARQMLQTYRALIGATPAEYDSARDDDGHGTHTASTVAGNQGVTATMQGQRVGVVSGIAPRARVIAYKGLGALGGFTSDLAAAIDQAVADGVDVINYSIGGGASAPNGADDIAFLFAADAGVFAATSAGNSGPDADTVGSPANAPWITSVGASTQARFFQGVVQATGLDENKDTKGAKNKRPGGKHKKQQLRVTGASITPSAGPARFVDAELAGGDLCEPGTLDAAAVEGAIVLCRRGAVGRADKSLAVQQAGGVGMVLYNNTDDDNLFTDTHSVPSVHVNNTDGVALKKFIADNDGQATVTLRDTATKTYQKPNPTMAYFSSRGPNGPVPDVIKPDLTAPGHQILAGASPGVDPFGDSFQAISGTSMSSPHVAGLFALLKQAHPDWSAAAAKSALMTTASRRVLKEDERTLADPFDFGAGHVDPGKPSRKNSMFDPGLVFDAGLFEYAAFTCGSDLGIFTAGSCDFVASLDLPFDPSDLNLPSIGVASLPGSQTVTRTVTNVADRTVTYRAWPRDPRGYDVSVSPRKVRLGPGESATVEVTIRNESAPLGEWRFGTLRFVGGGYWVQSPIAVNASQLDAPTEVAASVADGGTSFDVKFGYSGAYTAAPHGLVPSTVLSGSIGQDPDQTFPSGDDAPGPGGGVDRFPIDVSGSAYLRIALSIPGDTDIDLFLEDSTGAIVAASTNGGTDEQIDLPLPADGTYTLVVHGWSVPNRARRIRGRHLVGAAHARWRLAEHRQCARLGHHRCSRAGRGELDGPDRRREVPRRHLPHR